MGEDISFVNSVRTCEHLFGYLQCLILSSKSDENQAKTFIQGYKKLLAFYHDCFAVALIATWHCLALLTETGTLTEPWERQIFASTVFIIICAFLARALLQTVPTSLPASAARGLCPQVVCGQGAGEGGEGAGGES